MDLQLSQENFAPQSKEVKFYPNPFTTQMSISSSNDFENASFKLYNSVGQLVLERNNLNGKSVTLERENLSNGIYLIQLFQDGKMLATDKLVISN